jgi:hypothetical protein
MRARDGLVSLPHVLKLDDGPTENLSLFQCDSGLVDLLRGITVSHQLAEWEPAVTRPLQEEREIGVRTCGDRRPGPSDRSLPAARYAGRCRLDENQPDQIAEICRDESASLEAADSLT